MGIAGQVSVAARTDTISAMHPGLVASATGGLRLHNRCACDAYACGLQIGFGRDRLPRRAV